MWLVACDSSPPDHVHSQHASASKLPLHDRTGESSNLHQVNEPATNNAPSHAELGQVYVPAEASSSSDARVSTADPPRGSRRVTAESSSSESAAGGESASSYSGVSVPSGAFSIGANLSLSADGTSSSEAGVDEPSAEQPSNSRQAQHSLPFCQCLAQGACITTSAYACSIHTLKVILYLQHGTEGMLTCLQRSFSFSLQCSEASSFFHQSCPSMSSYACRILSLDLLHAHRF